MHHCAFLTIADQQGWFIDDDLVHQPLRELGWQVSDLPWTESVDWNRFDAVIVRSTWDYQAHWSKFLEVLRHIDASSAVLYNSLKTIEWNVNKRYLFELQAQGIETVPTLSAESGAKELIAEARETFGNDPIVLKPIVGANADDAYRIDLKTSTSELNQIMQVFSGRAVLAQPFMHHIVSEGEFSLIYFNGLFSHAVLKSVHAGDFRVQEEHGGTVLPVERPESRLLTAGQRVISSLPETPLYVRVDLVRTGNNDFALMELELIEPGLFFRFAESSASRFAAAIAERFYAERNDTECNDSERNVSERYDANGSDPNL